MAWVEAAFVLLWRNAWAVIPLALAVGLVCRWLPCRPSTRHALWVVVLVWFVAPAFLPTAPLWGLVEGIADTASGDRPSPHGIAAGTAGVGDEESPVAVILPEADKSPEFRDGRTARVTSNSNSRAERVREAQRQDGVTSLVRGEESSGGVSGKESPPNHPATAARTNRHPPCALSSPWDLSGLRSHFFDSETGAVGVSAEPAGRARVETRSGLDLISERSPDANSTTADKREAGPAVAASPPPADAVEDGPVAAGWRGWVGGLVAIRDAIAGLPAMPIGVWLGGCGLFVLVHAVRIWRFLRRLRRATPAPRWVAREVARLAKRFGLARPPETYMLEERVSPLVWCGRRAKLILPVGLWSELDAAGRRAVLCHELAHLRRRDAWICWTEMLVSALYWWHPVVWWVRRRIREEADRCCDAWVVWLLPHGRRAYAEALLKTNQYMSAGAQKLPAVGVGMTTVGAKRFARRLTMVMTGSMRPRRTVSGIALACVIVLAGWAATPALSVPPREGKKPKAKAHSGEKVPDVPQAPMAPRAVKAPKTFELHVGRKLPAPPEPPAPPPVPVTKAPWVRGGSGLLIAAGGPQPGDEMAERLALLEARLQALSAELQVLSAQLGRRSTGLLQAPTSPEPKGAQITRAYSLPEGKLEALTKLMARSDVPILVTPLEDGIEVHATAGQHKVFAAFVEMIHPTGTYSGALKEMQRGAFGGARSYQDALELFKKGSAGRDDALRAYERAGVLWSGARAGAAAESARAQAKAAESAALLKALTDQARGRAATWQSRVEALVKQVAALEGQAKALEDEASALCDQADGLREKAGDIEDQPQKRRALEREARGLERAAAKLLRQAEKLERMADELESQAEELESKAEDLQSKSDELEESLQTLNELSWIDAQGVAQRAAIEALCALQGASPRSTSAARAAHNAPLTDLSRTEVGEEAEPAPTSAPARRTRRAHRRDY